MSKHIVALYIALLIAWGVLFGILLLTANNGALDDPTYSQCIAENKPHEFCEQFRE